ncbi:MAG: GNAT family N-acetyltransferase [Nitrospiraceae bacterium]|nr:MAG: GNAT family N-acetyltransferase [Nitrospiraceae bacterium]
MSITASLVTDEKDLTGIYRLRYKVYCLEWGFEKPDNNDSGILTDVFDKHAVHFALKNSSQKVIAAVRLILDSEDGFPLERYCELNINNGDLPRDGLAEISRLVIHRDYRRRAEDKYVFGPDEERRSIGSFDFQYQSSNNRYSARRFEDRYGGTRHNAQRHNASNYERRQRHELVIGLYKAVYQESRRRQLTHWYAVMTKGIALLIEKLGLKFDVIGDPVDYHGIRTPYLGKISETERVMSETVPDLYEEFSRGK